MALKIRLRQQGRKNRQTFRLVLSDVRAPRDGRYIETLGWYNPQESVPEKTLCIQGERVDYWLKQGAMISEKAVSLVKRGAPHVIAAYSKKQVEAKLRANKKKKENKSKKELATA